MTERRSPTNCYIVKNTFRSIFITMTVARNCSCETWEDEHRVTAPHVITRRSAGINTTSSACLLLLFKVLQPGQHSWQTRCFIPRYGHVGLSICMCYTYISCVKVTITDELGYNARRYAIASSIGSTKYDKTRFSPLQGNDRVSRHSLSLVKINSLTSKL